MSQEFLRGRQRSASGDQYRRRSVPQIVHAQMWESGALSRAVERPPDRRGPKRSAALVREHAILVTLLRAKSQAFSVDASPVLA